MDLLVIHKPSDVKIDNQIGEFFEENNILEYKSPTDQGIRYSKRHQGIYDISDLQFIKCQVIITEEIDNDNFKWLSALTDKLTEAKARDVISTAYAMPQGENKRLAEAVVDVLLSANEKLFEKIKEDDIMASALMGLMKPEVDKKVKEERNMMAQIVSALMAGKDNDTIIKELNCTLDQITPMRTAMGKNKNYLIVFPKVYNALGIYSLSNARLQ